jgi:hypothetical protein
VGRNGRKNDRCTHGVNNQQRIKVISDDLGIFQIVLESCWGEGAVGVIWHIVARPKWNDNSSFLTLDELEAISKGRNGAAIKLSYP